MKTTSFLSFLIFFLISNFMVQDNYKNIIIDKHHIKDNNDECEVEKRKRIVFILGKDKENSNQYYKLAKDYYQLNPKNKGVLIVDTCFSLSSVKKFLINNPPQNQLPWGKINLIVHSNEWTGIGAPIFNDGKRATFELLSDAINKNKFEPINSKFIDDKSILEINACGLGKNKKFTNLIGKAFGCSKIHASEYFVMYENSDNFIEKFEAKSYYAYYKTGYRPADLILRKQFFKKYPEANIDWLDAFSRKKPRFFGDVYNYYFNVPVKWTVTYGSEEERPKFNSQRSELNWLKSQNDLMNMIEKTDIPFDKFRWKLKYTDYTFEDGITEPAIEINGKTTVLCVLQTKGKE